MILTLFYAITNTGSLISIKENVKDIVIPSEERHINMYPLDFEELATALGEDMLVDYMRQCFCHIPSLLPVEDEGIFFCNRAVPKHSRRLLNK